MKTLIIMAKAYYRLHEAELNLKELEGVKLETNFDE